MAENKKPFALVFMPFSKDFDVIYSRGIKPACEEAGCRCERLDEQYFTRTFQEQLNDQISKADIIIADLTNEKGNVFYEVGYAHARKKEVILLAQEEKEIPFYLKYYQVIIYENNSTDKLKEDLAGKIHWAIEESGIQTHPEEILSTQAKEIIKKIVATGQEKFNVVISRGEVFLQFYREGTRIQIYNRDTIQDDLNKLVKLGLLIYVRQNRDGHDIYKRGEKAINYVKRLRENEEAVEESMDSTIEGARHG